MFPFSVNTLSKSLLMAGLSCSAFTMTAQEKAPDKSLYWLLKPVPAKLMRPRMETDRPDVTESPYTVDAGHIQYECDLIHYKQSRDEEQVSRQWLINAFSLKTGLTNNADLQINLETYRREVHEQNDDHNKERRGNTGSLTLRLKQNLYGNDKGKFIIAVMPYVRFPSNSFFDHHAFEGGIIIPFQVKLPKGWTVGVQGEIDAVNEDGSYEGEILQSVTVSHGLFKNMKAIGETYYTYNCKQGEWSNYLDAFLQYNVKKNIAFDAGFQYGIQRKAEHDYFLGLSFRL